MQRTGEEMEIVSWTKRSPGTFDAAIRPPPHLGKVISALSLGFHLYAENSDISLWIAYCLFGLP